MSCTSGVVAIADLRVRQAKDTIYAYALVGGPGCLHCEDLCICRCRHGRLVQKPLQELTTLHGRHIFSQVQCAWLNLAMCAALSGWT